MSDLCGCEQRVEHVVQLTCIRRCFILSAHTGLSIEEEGIGEDSTDKHLHFQINAVKLPAHFSGKQTKHLGPLKLLLHTQVLKYECTFNHPSRHCLLSPLCVLALQATTKISSGSLNLGHKKPDSHAT